MLKCAFRVMLGEESIQEGAEDECTQPRRRCGSPTRHNVLGWAESMLSMAELLGLEVKQEAGILGRLTEVSYHLTVLLGNVMAGLVHCGLSILADSLTSSHRDAACGPCNREWRGPAT
eukprot:7324793-Prymnesium_polylepis.3